GSRDDSLSAEADVRRERSTRLERWSDVSKVTRSDVCSGRSFVFVDDAAEDVAAGDGCLVDRRHGRERGIGGASCRPRCGLGCSGGRAHFGALLGGARGQRGGGGGRAGG